MMNISTPELLDDRTLRLWQAVAGHVTTDAGNPSSGNLLRIDGVPLIREAIRLASREAAKTVDSMIPYVPSEAGLLASVKSDTALLERGVTTRSLFPTTAESIPHIGHYAKWIARHGAQVRSGPTSDARFLIFDRRVAIASAGSVGRDKTDQALLIQDEGIVTSLAGLFDDRWDRGADLTHEKPLSERDKVILHAIANGHKDTTIARDLGVHVTTVERATKALRERFDVSSRAELMSAARRQGWR
ncbi:MAG: LuxR C-terminal-related transcriptional regulator [Promicromonosporaceae bacterium]|nr:LuxR C-terminal-related transcriptional regulator [Promicromonosporaceae bacterium]